jgi:hypothetical protein
VAGPTATRIDLNPFDQLMQLGTQPKLERRQLGVLRLFHLLHLPDQILDVGEVLNHSFGSAHCFRGQRIESGL